MNEVFWDKIGTAFGLSVLTVVWVSLFYHYAPIIRQLLNAFPTEADHLVLLTAVGLATLQINTLCKLGPANALPAEIIWTKIRAVLQRNRRQLLLVAGSVGIVEIIPLAFLMSAGTGRYLGLAILILPLLVLPTLYRVQQWGTDKFLHRLQRQYMLNAAGFFTFVSLSSFPLVDLTAVFLVINLFFTLAGHLTVWFRHAGTGRNQVVAPRWRLISAARYRDGLIMQGISGSSLAKQVYTDVTNTAVRRRLSLPTAAGSRNIWQGLNLGTLLWRRFVADTVWLQLGGLLSVVFVYFRLSTGLVFFTATVYTLLLLLRILPTWVDWASSPASLRMLLQTGNTVRQQKLRLYFNVVGALLLTALPLPMLCLLLLGRGGSWGLGLAALNLVLFNLVGLIASVYECLAAQEVKPYRPVITPDGMVIDSSMFSNEGGWYLLIILAAGLSWFSLATTTLVCLGLLGWYGFCLTRVKTTVGTALS